MTEQALDQSFIVRVWFENGEVNGTQMAWRGMIEHVGSGEKRYFKALDEIGAVIALWLPKNALSQNKSN